MLCCKRGPFKGLCKCAELELGVSAAKKRGEKKKGPKRKTRAMLEAERRGPITFASLLEMAGDAGAPLLKCVVVISATHGRASSACFWTAQDWGILCVSFCSMHGRGLEPTKPFTGIKRVKLCACRA